MRLVFMGTPEFAVASLKVLAASRHEVVAVVTQPDRQKGRGRKLHASPVKQYSQQVGIPVLQPNNLKADSFHQQIAAWKPDLLVVVAFSILPESLFSLATFGAINLHGSLLPAYRGAAPIQWAIAQGETETGVTIFQLDRKMDHGSILAQTKMKIEPNENAGELFTRMQEVGSETLLQTVHRLEEGTLKPIEQDHRQATPARKLTKDDGKLDWGLPSSTLHNRIRGFNPFPICFTQFAIAGGEPTLLRIHASKITTLNSLGSGRFMVSDQGEPLVGCQDHMLALSQVQLPGKPVIAGKDFVNGLQQKTGLFFS